MFQARASIFEKNPCRLAKHKSHHAARRRQFLSGRGILVLESTRRVLPLTASRDVDSTRETGARRRSLNLCWRLWHDFPRIAVTDSEGVPLLSSRKEDVINGMAKGMANREIADALRLSENTFKNYLYRIFAKLGVSNRVEAVMYAAAHSGSLAEKPRTAASSDNLCRANAAVGA